MSASSVDGEHNCSGRLIVVFIRVWTPHPQHPLAVSWCLSLYQRCLCTPPAPCLCSCTAAGSASTHRRCQPVLWCMSAVTRARSRSAAGDCCALPVGLSLVRARSLTGSWLCERWALCVTQSRLCVAGTVGTQRRRRSRSLCTKRRTPDALRQRS